MHGGPVGGHRRSEAQALRQAPTWVTSACAPFGVPASYRPWLFRWVGAPPAYGLARSCPCDSPDPPRRGARPALSSATIADASAESAPARAHPPCPPTF